MRLLIALPLALCFAPTVQAHGGGLDTKGCHTNRRTGEYHCHQPSRQPRARNTRRGAGSDQMFLADSVYFPNCTAAWRAGAAPLRRGDPGYRPVLDRDEDGVACEVSPFSTARAP